MTQILIVEDEEAIRTALAENLKMEGFTVVEAADGEAAAECLEKGGIDFMILDLMLPKRSGTDVLRDLRAVECDRVAIGQYLRPSKESLPVVAYVEPAVFDDWGKRARELGFAWVMSSPFTRSSYHAEEVQA